MDKLLKKGKIHGSKLILPKKPTPQRSLVVNEEKVKDQLAKMREEHQITEDEESYLTKIINEEVAAMEKEDLVAETDEPSLNFTSWQENQDG